jgi:hypothetical protein
VIAVPGSTGDADSPQATEPRARSATTAPRLNVHAPRHRAMITEPSVIACLFAGKRRPPRQLRN